MDGKAAGSLRIGARVQVINCSWSPWHQSCGTVVSFIKPHWWAVRREDGVIKLTDLFKAENLKVLESDATLYAGARVRLQDVCWNPKLNHARGTALASDPAKGWLIRLDGSDGHKGERYFAEKNVVPIPLSEWQSESDNIILPIEALFIAVFHPVEGDMILCSDPPEFAEKDASHAGSPHWGLLSMLLPGPALDAKLILKKFGDSVVLGSPVNIADRGYDRNHFQFTVCIAVKMSDHDHLLHGALARNLRRSFRLLEAGHELDEPRTNPRRWAPRLIYKTAHKAPFRHQVKLFEALLAMIRGTVMRFPDVCAPLPRIDERLWSVQFSLWLDVKPPEVNPQDEQVPVRRVQREEFLARHQTTDLTYVRVLSLANGQRSIERIANMLALQIQQIKRVVMHLLALECVILIDAVHDKNWYTVTANFGPLYDQIKPENSTMLTWLTQERPEDEVQYMREIRQLYEALPGKSLEEFRSLEESKLTELRVDVRQFILYGLLRGLIVQSSEYE
mmetsp:Transcript_26601/g.61118  ORF Transcript_26601/g.61118 Transcript_26601/m.61118 type:complete len:506 (+) Transcript_26601:34-1551(+)